MINIKENEKLNMLNHSCAHLLAHAVKHLYPNAKFWVGPVINEGFYYDIDLGDEVIKEEDLPKIEKEMNEKAMELLKVFDLDKEADAVEAAVKQVLKEGYRTGDIMQDGMTKVKCSEMGSIIASNI